MGCLCFKQKHKQQQSRSDRLGKQQNQVVNSKQIRIKEIQNKNIHSLQKQRLQYLYSIENLDYCDYIQLKKGNDGDQIDYFVLSKFTIYFGQFNIETSKKEGNGSILQRQFDKNFNSSYFKYEGQFKEDQIVGSGKLFNQKSKQIFQEGEGSSISMTLNRHPQIAIKSQTGFIKIVDNNGQNLQEISQNQHRLLLPDEKLIFYDQQLNQQDLIILHGEQWLNSSIIDAYIEHLNYENEILYWALSKEYRKQFKRCYIVPSWLFSWFHYEQNDQNLKHFKDIFSQLEPIQYRIWEIYKKIGFVINENNKHWYFVQLDFETMEILVKDSISRQKNAYAFTYYILQNLFNQIDNQIKFTIKVSFECSQQQNTYDCGAYTCINAQELAEGKSERINTGTDMREYLMKIILYKF